MIELVFLKNKTQLYFSKNVVNLLYFESEIYENKIHTFELRMTE